MGSFNASCTISHAPLRGKDEVVLFYVVNRDRVHRPADSTFRGLGSDAWDHFEILGLPMEATYDDCGLFNIVQSPASDANLEIIKRYYTETPISVGGNYAEPKLYDVPAEDLDHERVQKMIREGVMYLDSDSTLTRRRFVSTVAVHKSVFDVLMDNTCIIDYNENSDRVVFNTLQEYITFRDHHEIIMKEKYEADFERCYALVSPLIGSVDSVTGLVYTAERAFENANMMTEVSRVSDAMGDREQFTYHGTNKLISLKTALNKIYSQIEIAAVESELRIGTFVNRAFASACEYYRFPIIPCPTASQNDIITYNASILANISDALLNKAKKEAQGEKEHRMQFNVIPASIEIKLSDLEEYVDEHWNDKLVEDVLDAIAVLQSKYRNEVLLTPDDVSRLGVQVLYRTVDVDNMALKIIIDI